MSFRLHHSVKLIQVVHHTRKTIPCFIKQYQLPNRNRLTLLRCSSSTSSTTATKSSAGKQREDQHEEYKDKYTLAYRKRMGNYYSMFIGSMVGISGSSYLIYKKLTSEAEAKGSVETNEDEEEIGPIHKSEAGFKERQIIEYENRIRQYSTPDKIFRYFGTLQDRLTGEIYMTPEDFVRALTPDTMQPPGLGLDQFKKIDCKQPPTYQSSAFGKNSVFHCFGDGGLMTFSDYLFLITLLGTSPRQIEIAFKMFDLNGDGEVSLEEFKKVRSLFLSMTTTGSRHRDRKTTGNVLNDEVSSGLAKYFFGHDGGGKLTSEQFVAFKTTLQKEIMYLEFAGFSPKDGEITACQFAELLLVYANFPPTKSRKIMKRVNAAYGDKKGTKTAAGVTFQDYLDFFNFLLHIRDIEMALSFHTVAGQPIDKATLKRVAKTVSGVELKNHVVDIVFSIFDENGDSQLSNKEFIDVMKDKMQRGLNKPKDTGLIRFLSAILTCSKSSVVDSWTSPTHSH